MTNAGLAPQTREHEQRDNLAQERCRVNDELSAIAGERDRLAEARELTSGIPSPYSDSLHRDKRDLLVAARLRDEAAIIRDLAANRRDLEANRAADPHAPGGMALLQERELAREDRVASRCERGASATDSWHLGQRSVQAMVSK